MANTTEPQFPNQSINNINKSVLVVGGGGYIGSHIAKHLVRNGYTPVIVDRNINTIVALAFHDCYEMDLPKDIHLLDAVVKRYNIDSCICTAAYTSVGESVKEPNKYYQNNVVMTLQLLNKLKDLDIKKFIFSSSAAVYGTPESGICYDDQIGLEPINPYGQTKLVVEKMLKEYNRAYGMKSISFRYFNAAGADPDGEIGVGKAAEKVGTMFGVSSLGTASIEEISKLVSTPKLFQLYVHKDQGLNDYLIEQCKEYNFETMAVTVDSAVGGNRERDLYTGFTKPLR